MRNLEKGQHIFIAFQNGKAVLDSQLRPRIYTSLENADKWTPTVNKGKIEYVEYAPTLTPPNEAPPCYQPDGDGCVYQCYDGDDEPIDKCKECPLCYSDKQRHHTPPNEWVSVEERLPEYNPGTGAKSYWVAKKDNAGNWQMKIAQYCDYGYAMTMDAETEVTWRDWDFTKIVNVTHWMLLPAPPDRRPTEVEK